MKKSVIIIGAGPGGLAAAMLLAGRGYSVDVYEKADRVGGRNALLTLGPNDEWKFDTGPTILALPRIYEELFLEVGLKMEDYVTLMQLDTTFKLQFTDFEVDMTLDRARMREQIEALFPGSGVQYDRFLADEEKRFSKIFPLLQKRYFGFRDLFDRRVFSAIPSMGLGKSVMDRLADYFDDERLRLLFTFQSKYIGMSPWVAPALFSILPYMEHHFGVFHVKGGLNQLSHGLAKAATELGARIHFDTPVAEIIIENGATVGVRLENGEKKRADDLVINADISYAFLNLFPKHTLKKWTPAKLEKAKYSCSTMVMYLAVDTTYPLEHNTISFSKDYRTFVENMVAEKPQGEDVSFYVVNTAATDDSMAPEGTTALYVLVPVSNQRAGTDWKIEAPKMREYVLSQMEERLNMHGIRDHILHERIITPDDWNQDFNIHLGAVFNLGHQLNQMMMFRPHNKFEELEHCFLVGGGTHPGSGLPTIYESARISANAIDEQYGVMREEPHSLNDLY